ncbi:MAG: hypothetical protein ACLP1X_01170 [Polyangiaceae bacterium]|jgi:hypothetical protein
MPSNTPKKNRSDQTAAEQKLIDAMSKYEQTIPSFVIAGGPVTTKDIISVVQTLIDSASYVDATRAQWQRAVKADRAQRDKLKKFMSVLRQALMVAFAGSVDTLEEFGLTPRKPAAVTREERVAAAAKAKVTRAARYVRDPVPVPSPRRI